MSDRTLIIQIKHPNLWCRLSTPLFWNITICHNYLKSRIISTSFYKSVFGWKCRKTVHFSLCRCIFLIIWYLITIFWSGFLSCHHIPICQLADLHVSGFCPVNTSTRGRFFLWTFWPVDAFSGYSFDWQTAFDLPTFCYVLQYF